MPLEIRELVIRTTVNSDRPGPQNIIENESQSEIWREENQAAIVATCTQQVLSILQSQSER